MADDFYPVGAIIPFAGELSENDNWLLCDGKQVNSGDYGALFDVIGHAYGGSGGTFTLPDYRGYFLRGAAHDTNNDPDKDSRKKRGDALPGGVGTYQDDATGRPRNPFTARFNHLYDQTYITHGTFNHNSGWNSAKDKQKTCTEGGDDETRPANVYVNFYIKAKAT